MQHSPRWLPWQPTWGGAGMGFSPCLPCKQDLGEVPSEARVPRPGGSVPVLQHAHVRCTRRGSERSEAAKAPT